MQKYFCDGWLRRPVLWIASCALVFLALDARSAERSFSVVSYNVKNYLLRPDGTRKAKPEVAKEALAGNLVALNADIVALQEMGGPAALADLQMRLKAKGSQYPVANILMGPDKAIQLAVLSRIPVVSRVTHTNVSYLIGTQRLWVSRGFDEILFKSDSGYEFTLINVHLKSKRIVPHADADEMRLHEARLLRRIIDLRLEKNPDLNLMIVGDLNDSPDSPAVKRVLSGGKANLSDLILQDLDAKKADTMVAGWTCYYAAKKAGFRYDYFLVSSGMFKEWIPAKSFVFSAADYSLASDHRPIIATFAAKDR